MNIFEILILQPIFNALVVLYSLFGDIGLAIIAITLIIRVLLLPLSNKAFRSQRRLQALQPELQKLQNKHKDEREVLARELMAFYKREGVSPASSCVPLLIQIPFLIALFFVFKDAVTGHYPPLYGFIDDPGHLKTTFLGLIDLANPDKSYVLPAIASVFQFVQSRMLLPMQAEGQMAAINKQMMFIFPIITFVFAATLPAALPLYWASTTVFTVLQQYLIMKKMPLAAAKAEGAADWNAANPADPIDAPKTKRTTKKPKGGNVTVRKRGKK